MPATYVTKRQGICFGREWLQYAIITDGRVRIVELEPAGFGSAFGWNLRSITEDAADAWPGMTAEQIVAFKLRTPDDCDKECGKAEAERTLTKWGFEVAPNAWTFRKEVA